MNRKSILVTACAAITGLGVYAFAAEPAKESKPSAAAPQLPPGWTEADMAAATEASTPGKMQAFLAKDAGTWATKSTFWMMPGAEGVVSEGTVTETVLMDGRFLRSEWSGEMPGMGPFHGIGTKGYDNAGGKFDSTWIDSMSTGIMTGTGKLSADGKTINWKFDYTCPLTKKPVVMCQIETWKTEDAKTLEMWGVEPKSGKEFKMMFAELTRKK